MALLLTKSEIQELCTKYGLIQAVQNLEDLFHINHDDSILLDLKHPLIDFDTVVICYPTYNNCYRLQSFCNKIMKRNDDWVLVPDFNHTVYSFTDLKCRIEILLGELRTTYLKTQMAEKLSTLNGDFE